MQDAWVQFLGRDHPLEEEMASLSSHNTVRQEFLALELKISSQVIQIRLGDKVGGLRETKGGPGREERKDKSS